MICPICGNEMAIAASRTCVDRDDRPDLATRVWVEQDLCCRNRQLLRLGQGTAPGTDLSDRGRPSPARRKIHRRPTPRKRTEPAAEQNEEG